MSANANERMLPSLSSILKSLPIGNLTSQFFGNVYLNTLAHYIKEHLQCRCYVRYYEKEIPTEKLTASLVVWFGHIKHANSYNLKRTMLQRLKEKGRILLLSLRT